MSDVEERASLIARIEAAREGSLDLDWAIAASVGWQREVAGRTAWWQSIVVNAMNKWLPSCPRFTCNLDAAMRLVPKGSSFQIGRPGSEGPYAIVGAGYIVVKAATPALAVCAAALKARRL